jgi:hypothetical protein
MTEFQDEQRINWLETNGQGYALVSDDNSHWACVQDGMQNCPDIENEPEDIHTTFFIEKHKWHKTIRGAIDAARKA